MRARGSAETHDRAGVTATLGLSPSRKWAIQASVPNLLCEDSPTAWLIGGRFADLGPASSVARVMAVSQGMRDMHPLQRHCSLTKSNVKAGHGRSFCLSPGPRP